ncbi:HPr(Ser) kinase/phosphatase [Mollicutes bacterium LVI A0078]|nr:HPr(Ser) kinase/phosphatase [Mollicutes bacterium LVI A0075]WOO90704.1 HPr(Ser) kinase/phosphatase [Mollicutes bacterium LVI A0078]
MKATMTVEQLLAKVKRLKLVTSEDTAKRVLTSEEVARPGLTLVTKSEHFPYERIQMYGKLEVEYLMSNNIDIKKKDEILNSETPLIVFAHGYAPTDEFIELAEQKGIALAVHDKNTTRAVGDIHKVLKYHLAPTTRVHGVLLNINGSGVLIKGASGIGKSEVALELIKKGHSLIADDAIIIKKLDDDELIGEAPDLLKNRMEIRGIGIINIQQHFGIASVAPQCKLDVVVEIVPAGDQVDRLGNDWKHESYLEVDVRKTVLPVSGGRSIANLIEIAVSNYQLKFEYNLDETEQFINDLKQTLISGKE